MRSGESIYNFKMDYKLSIDDCRHYERADNCLIVKGRRSSKSVKSASSRVRMLDERELMLLG